MANYKDLLENKRWQNKRARIIMRDGKCTVCGNKYDLCVHHTYYYKIKIDPWRYPDESLLTLCQTCHTKWHMENENIFIDKPLVTSKKKRINKIKIVKQKKKKPNHHTPRLFLAIIQANRDKYYKDEKGNYLLT